MSATVKGGMEYFQYKFCEKTEIEYFFGLVSISGDKKYIFRYIYLGN